MPTKHWLAVLLSFSACSGPQPDAELVPAPLVKGGRTLAPKHNFIGVFRPDSATWFLRMQRPGWVDGTLPTQSFVFGNPNDTPLVGDWNGDGVETQGVWRAGQWFLSNTLGANAGPPPFFYGNTDDVPLVGDWDGNGTTTPGVFRNGTFLLRNSNTAGVADVPPFAFGDLGDVPVAGDWDGDGVDTVGIYRPSDATFRLINANAARAQPDAIVPFGDPGDQPVMGDWNGDGVVTPAVKRGSTWFLRNNNTEGRGDISVGFGDPTDRPIAGNWRPSAGPGFSTAPASLASFFPLAADFQPSSSFPTWKARGINTVVRVPSTEGLEPWTAAARAIGFKMIRDARPDPRADANETNLLAWHIADEPDCGIPNQFGECQMVDARIRQIEDRYNALKAIAPNFPVFPNLTGGLVQDPGDVLCNGLGDTGALLDGYPRLLHASDWVSHDHYPVLLNQPLGSTGDIIDKLTRWAPGAPQFAYVEASAIAPGSREPTVDEFRGEIWNAIVHGARGIFYFPHGGCNPCQTNDATPPPIQDEMRRQNLRITGLATVLQSAINPATIGFRSGLPLVATWRQSGGKTYYIVLNFSPQSLTRTLTVTGFTPSAAFIVVGENRSAGGAGRTSFSDAFGPYEVHIYRTP
jgi:hypothetical protein